MRIQLAACYSVLHEAAKVLQFKRRTRQCVC